MLKWIFLDVKRTLKSKKTYLLLTMILVSMVWFVYSYDPIGVDIFEIYGQVALDFEISEDDYIRHQQLEFATNLSGNFPPVCIMEEEYVSQEELDATDCSGYDRYRSVMDTFWEYYQAEDTKGFYRLKLALLDSFTDGFREYYEDLSDEMKVATSKRVVAVDPIFKIKDDIKAMSIDEELFMPETDYINSIAYFNIASIELSETYYNYTNDYPLDVAYKISPGFFVANYIDSYFYLLVFAMILLIFDSYYRDFQSGVFKTILSSPTKRFSYVAKKTISTIISSFVLIGIPMFIMALYLYNKLGYTALNYPIYIQHGTLDTFAPRLKYSRIVGMEKPANLFSTYTKFIGFGPISRTASDSGSVVHSNLKVIMLSEYLFYVLGYFILIIVFISMLNSILSIVFNSRIINLLVLSLIIGVGIYLINVMPGNPILKFLPTTFLAPTKLLMTTIPFTYLNGLTTLSISTIVIMILANILIKRKDFTY